MSNRIGMTLRIGAAYDSLTVVRGGMSSVIDRSDMIGVQKKSLLRDVQNTRRFNASLI